VKIIFYGLIILFFSQSAYSHDYIIRGRTDLPYIALTFDDGPRPETTRKILSILKKHRVPATFFVIGKQVKKYPDLLTEEVSGGHEIGNHTYSHSILTNLTAEKIKQEILLTEQIVLKISGKRTKYFRPPAGHFNYLVSNCANRLGYKTILCTNNAGDYFNAATKWRPSEKYIKSKILGNIRGGAIILMHDGTQMTVDMLENIITNLQKRGYKFVTVSELIEYKSLAGKLPDKPLKL